MTAAAIAVRERPILFSGPMVRAILDGTKTQTRRVVLPLPLYHSDQVGWVWDRKGRGMVKPEGAHLDPPYGFTQHSWTTVCPYGQPGDRLWVRETALYLAIAGGPDREIMYADHEDYDICYPSQGSQLDLGWRVRPSIFMPRWASRITLEVTDVRVERVRDISEADAKAEGAPRMAMVHRFDPVFGSSSAAQLHDGGTHRFGFRVLWDRLNAKRGYGWDVNPWVWVLSITRVTP